jgi:hypothetical protein
VCYKRDGVVLCPPRLRIPAPPQGPFLEEPAVASGAPPLPLPLPLGAAPTLYCVRRELAAARARRGAARGA